MKWLVADVSLALRYWLRRPQLAVTAVLVVTLGATGSLVLASLLNALALRDLPVPHPEQLIGLTAVSADGGFRSAIPGPVLDALIDGQSGVDYVAGEGGIAVAETTGNTRSDVSVVGVTEAYYDALGIRAALGRLLTNGEIASGAPVAVISDGYWHRRYGGDAEVVGRSLELQGIRFTIVGVTDRSFMGLTVGQPTEVTIPIGLLSRVAQTPRSLPLISALIGRLAPDRTLAQVRAELEARWPQVIRESFTQEMSQQERDRYERLRPRIESLEQGFSSAFQQLYSGPVVLLSAASIILVIVACMNLSTILLAGSATTQHDLAVRLALGAPPAALVRQLIATCVLLTGVATAIALPPAWWMARRVAQMMWMYPDAPPLDLSVTSRQAMAISLFVLAAGLLAALVPAYRVTRADFLTNISGLASPVARTQRWGRRLLIAQTAFGTAFFALAIIVASNLAALAERPGLAGDRLALVGLDVQEGGYARGAINVALYQRQMVEDLSAIPGVESAALLDQMPLGPYSSIDQLDRRPVGRATASSDDSIGATVVQVSPRLFETIGVSLLRGRDFSWSDDKTQPPVAILSAGLAAALYQSSDPLGERIRIGTGPRGASVEVVGVVQNTRLTYAHDRNPRFVYVPLMQAERIPPSPFVFLRGITDVADGRAAEVRRRIESHGQDYVVWLRTFDDHLALALTRDRLVGFASAYFALLAGGMLVVGIAGVLFHSVSNRRRDLAIRFALGATRTHIRGLVLRESLEVTVIGTAIGLFFAWMCLRLVGYELETDTTWSFVVAALVALGVAVTAAWPPAQRAVQLSTTDAIRRV